MSARTKAADNFIAKKSLGVNGRYRHSFHLSAPVGWINDPNGFVYAFGEYRLFYQFNPYLEKWGPMHWGHASTKDFVIWKNLPVALAPDESYDEDFGAFSGSAIFDKGMLKLFYTGVTKKNNVEKQQQCCAYSEDGVNFVKYENNPVLPTEAIPDGFDKVDFRDPKVFKRGDTYYCLLAAKSLSANGQILMYKSKNCIDWEYAAPLLDKRFDMDGAMECPDYFELDSKDILMCSPQFLKSADNKHQNVHSSIYMIGEMDFEAGKFALEHYDDIDSGFDFYAPQTIETPDGRRVMTAWMSMWERSYPTACDGWVGAMIFPRELFFAGGKLMQRPVEEIERYRKNEVKLENISVGDGETAAFRGVCGDKAEIILTADISACGKFGLKLFADGEHETLLYYDKGSRAIVLDRSKSGIAISANKNEEMEYDSIRKAKIEIKDGILKLRLLLDVSSIEAFVQDGEKALTANVYSQTFGKGVYFFSEGGEAEIKLLKKYDIEVPAAGN